MDALWEFLDKKGRDDYKSAHWNIFDSEFFDLLKSERGFSQFRRNGLSCYLETGMQGRHRAVTIRNRWLFDEAYNADETQDVVERYEELCKITKDPKWIAATMDNDLGEPRHALFKGLKLNVDDLFHVYATWQIQRMTQENQKEGSSVDDIVEIGGGYGNLAHKLIKALKCRRYVIFDLPETIAIQYYYLKTLLPSHRIVLGAVDADTPFDIALVPGWETERMAWFKPNLVINMRSFGEMTPEVVSQYFQWIQKGVAPGMWFYTVNRYVFTISGLKLKDYPFDNQWEAVISQPQWLQTHLHEFMLRRTLAPSNPPFAALLASFPERTPPPGPTLPPSIMTTSEWNAFNKNETSHVDAASAAKKPRINVIFPMAGDGIRFGGTFKPFLQATDVTFIECAKEPFNRWRDVYDLWFYFVVRQDQARVHHVEVQLQTYFPDDHARGRLHVCQLDSATTGPCETTAHCVLKCKLSGTTFVCDCDHAIEVDPIFATLSETAPEAMPEITLPVWPITMEEQGNWGKVKTRRDAGAGAVLAFAEKEPMPFHAEEEQVWGMIGCYAFRDISTWTSTKHAHFSDVFRAMLAEGRASSFRCVQISNAAFFGDPTMLHDFRRQRNAACTLLVDLDGTILEQKERQSYAIEDNTVLPGSIESLTKWRAKGHCIVLTSARNAKYRDQLSHLLHELDIPFDNMLLGVHSGPRIVINDKKPYLPFMAMAHALQPERNQGIAELDWDVENDVVVVSTLLGASFATTYLIEKPAGSGTRRVRKYIRKSALLFPHYQTLKRQCEDLRRFNAYVPDLVPAVLGEKDGIDDYFYDMEYLENYRPLCECDESCVGRVVKHVVARMKKDVYAYKKPIAGMEWWQNFYHEKLLPKFAVLVAEDPALAALIESPWVRINGRRFMGIQRWMDFASIEPLLPRHSHPIHGDLTFENILVNEETGDVRILDNDGSRFMDCMELDLGKLFQSAVAKYGTWSMSAAPDVFVTDGADDITHFTMDESYMELDPIAVAPILEAFESDIAHPWQAGLLYLATWLIRMSPFMKKKSEAHRRFALVLACYYMNVAGVPEASFKHI